MSANQLAELSARLDALEAENAALRAAGNVAVAPNTTLEVVFTELAVRTVNDSNSRPVKEVVGKPGETKALRTDQAEAWIRRGKCLRASSDEAKDFLKDKDAIAKATAAADAQLRDQRKTENQRKTKEETIEAAAEAKDA